MRIATWNINGLRARLDFVRHWLDARQPDVVGLQELKLEESKVPVKAFADLGYEVLVHSQKSWNGVAVLSRQPIEILQKGLPGEEDFGARLLTVRTGGLVYTTVYCPNGKSVEHEDFPAKLRWYESLTQHISETRDPDEPFAVGGDFNICPAAEDSWNDASFRGQIFHTNEERQRFRALIDWGLEDVYRTRGPNDGAFSWWDYRAGAFHRNHGLRIDFLLATPTLSARVTGVTIDRDYRKKKDGLIASDHAPVIAELAEA